MTYIAFLRGINVGGNKKVPMETLKKVFEDMGCTHVQTILNTGNVIFTPPTHLSDATKLTNTISTTLEKAFGFPIGIILKSSTELFSLVRSDPFKGTNVTPDIRLYVTFVPGKPDLCNVIDISGDAGTTNFMKTLEKKYGKNITTRNWNTILRIAKLL